MQKNTQLLKWALLLLILPVIGVASLSGKLSVAQADTTAPSSPGSCQLSWKGPNGGGGTTNLDFSKVTDDGLKKTLEGQGTPPGPGYNLKCAEQHTSCQLVPGSSSGSIKLDLTNIQTSSQWLHDTLNSNKYSLSCDGSQLTKQLSKQKSKAKKAKKAKKASSSNTTCLGGSTPTDPNAPTNPTAVALPPGSTPPSTVNVNGNSSSPSGNSLPNSDCNSNTPAPSAGSCQVAWKTGGGGTTNLDLDQVTDTGLQQTLSGTGTGNPPGYNLKCADQHTDCELIRGSGDTPLDLANVQNRSPWIYQQLVGYSLKCNSDTDGH